MGKVEAGIVDEVRALIVARGLADADDHGAQIDALLACVVKVADEGELSLDELTEHIADALPDDGGELDPLDVFAGRVRMDDDDEPITRVGE